MQGLVAELQGCLFRKDARKPWFGRLPSRGYATTDLLPPQRPLLTCQFLRHKRMIGLNFMRDTFRVEASSADFGTGRYEQDEGKRPQKEISVDESKIENISEAGKQRGGFHFTPIAGMLVIGSVAAAVVTLISGGSSALMAAIGKSGFTAAFTLIFASEIGDKTFFIAALLAMQYAKGLVLLGSMGALSLMTIISVVIGRVFHSIPAQFQTTLPIGEYAAVALLLFFGFKSIKNAWDLPSGSSKTGGDGHELGELVEAEELVKAKVAKRLSTPTQIIWESFCLVFFAEWGDRSMLATIALGAAQSPWGVASGAIGGHLVATSLAILGGAFLAHHISEKLKCAHLGRFGLVHWLSELTRRTMYSFATFHTGMGNGPLQTKSRHGLGRWIEKQPSTMRPMLEESLRTI